MDLEYLSNSNRKEETKRCKETNKLKIYKKIKQVMKRKRKDKTRLPEICG